MIIKTGTCSNRNFLNTCGEPFQIFFQTHAWNLTMSKSQFLVFYVCYKLVMMFKWNKLNFDISLTKFNLNTFIVNLTKRTYFNSSECERLRVWSLVVSFHLIKVTKSPAVISFMAIPHFLIFFFNFAFLQLEIARHINWP